jgi:hypothetical protein
MQAKNVIGLPNSQNLAPQGLHQAILHDFTGEGLPRIRWQQQGGPLQVAQSLCRLEQQQAGCKVVVSFLEENPEQPVILGILHETPLMEYESVDLAQNHAVTTMPDESLPIEVDGRTIRLTASEQLELKCGKAHISLSADGKIRIRGGYILNHATGINRIRGAAVQVN